MQEVGILDIGRISSISPNVDTTVLVLSDERIIHIGEGHPGDYEKYGMYMRAVAEAPNFIMRDPKHDNTGIYVKRIEDETVNLRLTVRFHSQGDDPYFSNSVLTFQQIRDQEYRRLKKKTDLIVYTSD